MSIRPLNTRYSQQKPCFWACTPVLTGFRWLAWSFFSYFVTYLILIGNKRSVSLQRTISHCITCSMLENVENLQYFVCKCYNLQICLSHNISIQTDFLIFLLEVLIDNAWSCSALSGEGSCNNSFHFDL